MSTISEIRTALAKVRAEQDRLRSERTTITLQLEASEREKQRLEAQLRAVTTVPSNRQVNIPPRGKGAA